MENQKTYPIKAISRITGISQHVLRAWEKRYNAIEPIRTDTNRRLYTEEDLTKLKLLKKLTDDGYNIGSVANFKMDQLLSLVHESESTANNYFEDKADSTDAQYFFDECVESIYNFDPQKLEQNLNSALIKLSHPALLENVIIPLVRKVGHNWEVGELRIYHEHMVSVIIKSFLISILDSYKKDNSAPRILITTPQGQIHEIGAIAAAINAAEAGWNVNYMGTDLPAEEIVAAAIELKAKAIAISIVYSNDEYNLTRDLLKLGKILPSQVKFFVGGNAASKYSTILNRMNAVIIHDFSDFRKELSRIHEE